jgi:hypothetical protein
MRRTLRHLPIAFSATCLIACVLLIALWVRSYPPNGDEGSARGIFFYSSQGTIIALKPNFTWAANPTYAVNDLRNDMNLFVTIAPHDSPIGFYAAWQSASEWVVQVPHWFLVLISATLAAVPWIRWSSRFSLRTLLIVTTLVAVVLGLIVYVTRQ